MVAPAVGRVWGGLNQPESTQCFIIPACVLELLMGLTIPVPAVVLVAGRVALEHHSEAWRYRRIPGKEAVGT